MVKFWNIVEPDLARAINIIESKMNSLDLGSPVRDYIDNLISTGSIDETMLEALSGRITMVIPSSSPKEDYKEGTSQVIISGGNAVVVDLGWSESQAVIDTCLDRGVTHITALCCTHVHNDHFTPNGVNALISVGLLDSSSRIYWSEPDWSLFDGLDYASVYRQIEQIAVNNNIPIVTLNTEGAPVETGITGLYCNAFNCSDEVFRSVYGSRLDENYYLQNNDDLNYFSTCYRFQFGHSKWVCCGDIMPTNQAYLYPIFTDCNFYSVPHHGLNIWGNTDFMVNTPSLCYVGCYRANTARALTRGYIDTHGKRMYTNQNREIVFTVSHFTVDVTGELVNTTAEAGQYLTPGTNLFNLPFGKYFSPNETTTNSLVNKPDFHSGFMLTVEPGAREETHLTATSLYNWHSERAECNASVGVWSYNNPSRDNPN